MSVEALKAAKDWCRNGNLSPGARNVLRVLAEYENADTGRAFPNVATIEADTGYSRRHVQRFLAEIKTVGAVEYVRRPRQSTVYRVRKRKIKGDTGGTSLVK